MSINLPKVGDAYKHYKKGSLYKVIALGFDSETTEKVVIYQGDYTDPEFGVFPIWVRPLSEWMERVEFAGKEMQRFSKIN